MTVSASGAFRYAGLAALPIVLALAFVSGENAHRSLSAIGQGPQTRCIADASHATCPDVTPTASGDMPFIGELTVTAPRSAFTPPAIRSAAERSGPSLPQVRATPTKFSSIL